MGEVDILLPDDHENGTGISHSKCLGHYYRCHQMGAHAYACYLARMANVALAKKLLARESSVPIEVRLEKSSTWPATLFAGLPRPQRRCQPPAPAQPSPNQTLGTARAH